MQLLEPADGFLRVGCFLTLPDKALLQLLFRHACRCDNAHGPRLCRRFSGSSQQRLIVFLRQLHSAVKAEVRNQIRLGLQNGIVVKDELDAL